MKFVRLRFLSSPAGILILINPRHGNHADCERRVELRVEESSFNISKGDRCLRMYLADETDCREFRGASVPKVAVELFRRRTSEFIDYSSRYIGKVMAVWGSELKLNWRECGEELSVQASACLVFATVRTTGLSAVYTCDPIRCILSGEPVTIIVTRNLYCPLMIKKGNYDGLLESSQSVRSNELVKRNEHSSFIMNILRDN